MVFEHDYERFPELTQNQIQEFGFTSPHKQITEDFDAVVVNIHDGDTVTLRTGFRDFDFPLRLLEIDAPELNEGGEQAKQWLITRVLNQQVHIMMDRFKRVGKYGRLLGKIFHRGLDVGQEMLYLGLVVEFGREAPIPNINKIFRLNQWF